MSNSCLNKLIPRTPVTRQLLELVTHFFLAHTRCAYAKIFCEETGRLRGRLTLPGLSKAFQLTCLQSKHTVSTPEDQINNFYPGDIRL
jgi:hypothetical protein